jgi:ribonuclease HI
VGKAADIFIDGACRGNPGPASVGIVFYAPGSSTPTHRLHKAIGRTTNNVAEYTAMLYALQEAHMRGIREVHVRTDSELVARQLIGTYRVKDPNLKQLFDQVIHLSQDFTKFQVTSIPREQNVEADRLANLALDEVAAGQGKISRQT